MKLGKASLMDMAAAVDQLSRAKHDVVVDSRSLEMIQTGTTDFALMGEGELLGDLNPHSHGQMSARLQIPKKYYDRMQEQEPDLLKHNVNRWLQHSPTKRMVRTYRHEVGGPKRIVRAVMSDRYQRIDNYDVLANLMPVLNEVGIEYGLDLKSCEVTDSKMYAKLTSPRLRGEVKAGDVVEAGVSISNSEIGMGIYVISPFIYRLWCDNGCGTDEGKFSRRHVGAQTEMGEQMQSFMTDETNRVVDQGILLQSRDTLKGILSEEVFGRNLTKLQNAANGKEASQPIQAMEVLANSLGLTEDENRSALMSLLKEDDMTKWGFCNAVTQIANEHEDYDRASELENMGGKVIDLSASEWSRIAEAA
uniref:DUF932 domain-containing protein n=1 Tax=uncultured marine virus TaxID=186617 RepID=A0A0F7L922_9VIRU|nr:hypothetical protein AM1_A0346 [uncultured marine virus]